MSDSDLLENAAYTAPPVFQAEKKLIFGTGWHVASPAACFAGTSAGPVSAPAAFIASSARCCPK